MSADNPSDQSHERDRIWFSQLPAEGEKTSVSSPDAETDVRTDRPRSSQPQGNADATPGENPASIFLDAIGFDFEPDDGSTGAMPIPRDVDTRDAVGKTPPPPPPPAAPVLDATVIGLNSPFDNDELLEEREETSGSQATTVEKTQVMEQDTASDGDNDKTLVLEDDTALRQPNANVQTQVLTSTDITGLLKPSPNTTEETQRFDDWQKNPDDSGTLFNYNVAGLFEGDATSEEETPLPLAEEDETLSPDYLDAVEDDLPLDFGFGVGDALPEEYQAVDESTFSTGDELDEDADLDDILASTPAAPPSDLFAKDEYERQDDGTLVWGEGEAPAYPSDAPVAAGNVGEHLQDDAEDLFDGFAPPPLHSAEQEKTLRDESMAMLSQKVQLQNEEFWEEEDEELPALVLDEPAGRSAPRKSSIDDLDELDMNALPAAPGRSPESMIDNDLLSDEDDQSDLLSVPENVSAAKIPVADEPMQARGELPPEMEGAGSDIAAGHALSEEEASEDLFAAAAAPPPPSSAGANVAADLDEDADLDALLSDAAQSSSAAEDKVGATIREDDLDDVASLLDQAAQPQEDHEEDAAKRRKLLQQTLVEDQEALLGADVEKLMAAGMDAEDQRMAEQMSAAGASAMEEAGEDGTFDEALDALMQSDEPEGADELEDVIPDEMPLAEDSMADMAALDLPEALPEDALPGEGLQDEYMMPGQETEATAIEPQAAVPDKPAIFDVAKEKIRMGVQKVVDVIDIKRNWGFYVDLVAAIIMTISSAVLIANFLAG